MASWLIMPGSNGKQFKMFSLMGFVTLREKKTTLFIRLSPFKNICKIVSKMEDKISMLQCRKSYEIHKI
jgi:hypothetical protein